MQSPDSPAAPQRVSVIDSHTCGEPTRCVIDGGPDLGGGTLTERCERFRSSMDWFRTAVLLEPRGSDILVGALLCEPDRRDCIRGVIFFNNVSTLGMCGHGTIGVAVTLAQQGLIEPGTHALDTPVGRVEFHLHEDRSTVSLQNVPSYRHKRGIAVDLPNYGTVVGDIAWGGNWFFLIGKHGQILDVSRVAELTRFTREVRASLDHQGITGADGQIIDHIELCSDSDTPNVDCKNFVLCPGGAYDRSPCGTGTSAKLACLAADDLLAVGQTWRQESIIQSVFEANYQSNGDGTITPMITGAAWVTAESSLLFDATDPFRLGIRE